jgi:hypothetical protein
MILLTHTYWVVRYSPLNVGMPLRNAGASWWIPTQESHQQQIRLFPTKAKAENALKSWRKGGLVRSCRITDLSREEAEAYQIHSHENDLVERWVQLRNPQEVRATTNTTTTTETTLGLVTWRPVEVFEPLRTTCDFSVPVYVRSLQVVGWTAEERQANRDFDVVPCKLIPGL